MKPMIQKIKIKMIADNPLIITKIRSIVHVDKNYLIIDRVDLIIKRKRKT
jgi:hypothetical protein